MKTLKVDEKEYEIVDYAADGLPIIRGIATSTQDGFDEYGNPKVSVNIAVPSIVIGLNPGKNGE